MIFLSSVCPDCKNSSLVVDIGGGWWCRKCKDYKWPSQEKEVR